MPVIRELNKGMIVKHFKRETVEDKTSNDYLYKIIDFAEHTETKEKLVIYQALYEPYKTYARPFGMFFSKVDKIKYHNIKQTYRFEEYKEEEQEEIKPTWQQNILDRFNKTK